VAIPLTISDNASMNYPSSYAIISHQTGSKVSAYQEFRPHRCTVPANEYGTEEIASSHFTDD